VCAKVRKRPVLGPRQRSIGKKEKILLLSSSVCNGNDSHLKKKGNDSQGAANGLKTRRYIDDFETKMNVNAAATYNKPVIALFESSRCVPVQQS
jgi:hypothetical protein